VGFKGRFCLGVRVLFSLFSDGDLPESKQKSLTLLFGCKIYKIILAKKKTLFKMGKL
jgi:hypothetical protein